MKLVEIWDLMCCEHDLKSMLVKLETGGTKQSNKR